MRFRTEQHLRRPADIRTVRETGSRLDCRAFTLWWRKRTPAEGSRPRVGVVASRVSVGGAIQRNRAKRRLREIFRLNQGLVPPDCDLLLVARSDVIRKPYSELGEKFVAACRRIGSPPPSP
jgi:ribonuclease P protein component